MNRFVKASAPLSGNTSCSNKSAKAAWAPPDGPADEPVARGAVKLIKAGMDSKLVIARFDAGASASPHGAPEHRPRLDAGTSSTGRPYFSRTSSRACRSPSTATSTASRQGSGWNFMPVFQAIQHAHQKGIIHRDLAVQRWRPLRRRKPVPKVIDSARQGRR